MSDRHGSKDVTFHEDNVVLHKNKMVVGSTLNNILLSLFTLHTKSLTINGSWVILEEILCVMLLTVASIDHILQRIFNLVLCVCFAPSNDRVQKLAQGAVTFLSYWTKTYWKFMSPQNFNRIKQLLVGFSLHIAQHKAVSMENFVSYFAEKIRECVATCSSHMSESTPPPVVTTAAYGHWEKYSEKSNMLDGSLESIEESAAKEKPVGEAPPVIAVFGVTQDMLDHSDMDDDDKSDTLSNFGAQKPSITRVSVGFDLLQDHKDVHVWDFDVQELARQWTLLDHSLFLDIPLTHLERCQWASPRHDSQANEIRRFIDRFNAESCWVTQSLLDQPTPQKRAALYMKFIFLASFLEEYNNFNGLMAVLTAVQQSCITRLKDTLSFVNIKTNQILKRLQTLMSNSMNYKKYREHLAIMLEQKHHGIVPHLGIHLAEICSIEEGNTSYVLGAAHLINVEKLQLFARCFLFIGQMQAQSYSFCCVKLVQVCLLYEFRKGRYLSSSHAAKWSKEMFDKSSSLEGIEGINDGSANEDTDITREGRLPQLPLVPDSICEPDTPVDPPSAARARSSLL